MKRFRGQIPCIFNRQNLKVLLYLFYDSLTTKSIMLMKIVHRRPDLHMIAWELLRGSNTLMDPCRSNIGGEGPDPCSVDAYGCTQMCMNELY